MVAVCVANPGVEHQVAEKNLLRGSKVRRRGFLRKLHPERLKSGKDVCEVMLFGFESLLRGIFFTMAWASLPSD